jgi:putative ABC transport system permease protein
MSGNIRQVISALRHNWTGALLVAMQIAITLAVLANAVYIVKQRFERTERPTGFDVDNVFAIASAGFAQDFDYVATMREDLAYLRSVPGVVAATASNAVPLGGGSGAMSSLATKPNDEINSLRAGFFEVDEQGIAALGVRLVAGRPFEQSDVLPPAESVTARMPQQIIITQALADALFPNQNALGKTVYDSVDTPVTVVGIIEHMQGASADVDYVNRVSLVPRLPSTAPRNFYLVRTEPGQRDAVMRMVEEHITTSNPDRMISWVRSLEEAKRRVYLADRNMAIFLVTITALLLGLTALSLFGLATFNVNARIKQIGTRRALGARRVDIVRYFLFENWLITTIGIAVGCLLTLAASHWLSREYGLPRLDLIYLVGGVGLLWVLGQIAAWQPARAAAEVPPAVATRRVA